MYLLLNYVINETFAFGVFRRQSGDGAISLAEEDINNKTCLKVCT